MRQRQKLPPSTTATSQNRIGIGMSFLGLKQKLIAITNIQTTNTALNEGGAGIGRGGRKDSRNDKRTRAYLLGFCQPNKGSHFARSQWAWASQGHQLVRHTRGRGGQPMHHFSVSIKHGARILMKIRRKVLCMSRQAGRRNRNNNNC